MHEMLIAYEDKIAAVPMEAIVLNATVAKGRVRFDQYWSLKLERKPTSNVD
jgi:hypothetical protein